MIRLDCAELRLMQLTGLPGTRPASILASSASPRSPRSRRCACAVPESIMLAGRLMASRGNTYLLIFISYVLDYRFGCAACSTLTDDTDPTVMFGNNEV